MRRRRLGAGDGQEDEPLRSRLPRCIEGDLDRPMVGPEECVGIRLVDTADQVDQRVAARQHLDEVVRPVRIEDGDPRAELAQRLRGGRTPDRRPHLVARKERAEGRSRRRTTPSSTARST